MTTGCDMLRHGPVTRDGNLEVVDRRRIELVEGADASWARQPYHTAQGLNPEKARALVKRGIEAARRGAVREIQAAAERAREAGHETAACAVLVAGPMRDWSVDEILAVHFRMHKAEGVLFRDALLRAADGCGLRSVAISEKQLAEHAKGALAIPAAALMKRLATLGKSAGPPWGKDQKDAATAAMIGLQSRTR